jgi:RHS repeat-associated protein
VLAHHVYFPFGEQAGTSQDTDQMKFTAHERDLQGTASVADDLDYMHARFYNPQVGRFLTNDPINSANPGQPQSWNRYSYALNNPVKFVDPDGMAAIEANVRSLLEAFFGSSLLHVNVRWDPTAYAITKAAGAPGVTIGNTVYLSLEGMADYDAKTLEGILLIAHEVVHTFDYQRVGVAGFLADYVGIQSFRGLMDNGWQDSDYRNISYERRAYATEAVLREFLQTDAGKAVLGKLQAGGGISDADRNALDAFLVNKLSNGQLRLGFQFVEGKLVFVRMTN